jgi:hypothetical protein
MSGTNGKRWNSEEYRRRKAQRDKDRPAEWVTNPETGSEFYLRRVGAVGYAISGSLPHNLTNEALTAWQAQGLEVGAEGTPKVPQIDPKKLQAAQRNLDMVAVVVRDACVIPKIVIGASAEDEIDPVDLDDKDILFIFRYATGQSGAVALKGGAEVAVQDLQTFPEQPGELPGTGPGSEELLAPAQ